MQTPEIIYLMQLSHVVGDNFDFNNEDFFTLKMGDKVSSIGNDKKTSSNRKLVIQPYLEYVGSLMIPFNNDLHKFFMFLLPEKVYNQNAYLAIAKISDDEMLIPRYSAVIGCCSYIMKPVFKLV